MLLGHPANAGGSLARPNMVCQLGACLCSHNQQQNCREMRHPLGTAEKEKAAGCHWKTAENWQQQLSWKKTRVKLEVLLLL